MKAKIEAMGQNTRPVQVVLDETDLSAIDDWRRTQPGIPARGTAIRYFVRKGIKAEGQTRDEAAA